MASTPAVICLTVLCASQVGTQAAAWQFAHHPVLGRRLVASPQPLYPPTGLYQWSWGLARLAGVSVLYTDARLRVAWSAWCVTLMLGLAGAARRAQQPTRLTDQFAGRQVLRRAGLLGSHGVVLGRVGWCGPVVMDDSPTHVLIRGRTRGGKGEGVVVPTLLGGWRESVLVYDPKGELAHMTGPWRATFSTVYRCDPTSLTTHGCNLLASVAVDSPTEYRASARLMARLTDPDGTAAQHETATGRHFRELSTLIGQGLLLYGLRIQRTTLADIALLVATTPPADLAASMTAFPHPVIQAAALRLQDLDGPQREGVMATLARALVPFLDPSVGRLTGRPDFSLETLRQTARPFSLYYSVPFGDQDQLRPMTRLWFHTVFDALLRSQTDWHHRVLVLLDESTTLRNFPLLVDGFDFVAGYGIKLCLLVTSGRRLVATFGPHHNFEEGSEVRLDFAPNTRESARQLADETGERWQTHTRISRPVSVAQRGQKTVSEDEQAEPLLTTTGVAHLGRRRVLLRVGADLTAKLWAIRAWKERPWRTRRTPLPTRNAPLKG